MAFDFNMPRFNTQQLLACAPGLTHNTFKQWLTRDAVRLSAGLDIGRGKRPQYRGIDAAQVALRHALSGHGLVQEKFAYVWMQVETRIRTRWTPLGSLKKQPMAVFLYLHPLSGELHSREVCEAEPRSLVTDSNEVPEFHLYFRVDRFLDRLVERMERVLAGMPAEKPLTPADSAKWSNDFAIDEAGQRVLVGLSLEETRRYLLLEQQRQNGELPADARVDHRALDQKHNVAWAKRVVSLPQLDASLDHTGQWENRNGTRALIGLTADETEESLTLSARSLAYRRSDFMPRLSDEESDRLEQLTMQIQRATFLATQRHPEPQGFIQRVFGRSDAPQPKKGNK